MAPRFKKEPRMGHGSEAKASSPGSEDIYSEDRPSVLHLEYALEEPTFNLPTPDFHLPTPDFHLPEPESNLSEPGFDSSEPEFDMPEPESPDSPEIEKASESSESESASRKPEPDSTKTVAESLDSESDSPEATANPPEVVIETLLDREERLIAELLASFRNLVLLATEPVDNSASAGQAAYNNMAMEIETNGMIKSAEELLQLTRLIRELWIVGPLRKPGEGEREAEVAIGGEVQGVVGLLNQMRERSRQDLINQGTGQAILGQGSYSSGSAADGKGDGAPVQTGSH